MNKKDTIWRNNKLHDWFNISPWETIAWQWTTFNVSCIQRNDDLLAILSGGMSFTFTCLANALRFDHASFSTLFNKLVTFSFLLFIYIWIAPYHKEKIGVIVCSHVYICLHSIMIHCVQWCGIRRLCCRGAYVSCGQDCQVVQMFVFHGRHQVIHGAFGFISFDMIFLHPEHLAGAL